MLTYELAKALKDAGFPHTHNETCYFNITTDDVCNEITLSKLIEACGDRFDYLVHTKGTRKSGWYAEAGLVHQGGGMDGECIVSTPEEAVANLYIALNKK